MFKLGIRVAKRTIQKYLRQLQDPRPRGQSWATFLRTHGHEVWACDFLQTYDLFFRPLFAFFLIELGSRRVVHSVVTRAPSSAWVTQLSLPKTPYVAGSTGICAPASTGCPARAAASTRSLALDDAVSFLGSLA